jgi:hypothetical protein
MNEVQEIRRRRQQSKESLDGGAAAAGYENLVLFSRDDPYGTLNKPSRVVSCIGGIVLRIRQSQNTTTNKKGFAAPKRYLFQLLLLTRREGER